MSKSMYESDEVFLTTSWVLKVWRCWSMLVCSSSIPHLQVTRWYPHVLSDVFTNMFVIADWFSFHCCGSTSFMMNMTQSLSHLGTRLGIASLKTQQQLNLCWLRMKIQNHTTCLPMDICEENVSRWKPLLLEWDVTSSQTTSGHSLNNWNAGFSIQATSIKVHLCSVISYHDILQWFAQKGWTCLKTGQSLDNSPVHQKILW